VFCYEVEVVSWSFCWLGWFGIGFGLVWLVDRSVSRQVGGWVGGWVGR
jgi:hypothetical protein